MSSSNPVFHCPPIPWELTQADPISVFMLGDVHGNAFALHQAITTLRASELERARTHVIVLGDLLTYGCHPREVLDLTETLVAEFQAELLLGNHDQLYLDQLAGNTEYYDGLPDWLQESIDWTSEQIDLAAFRALPWRESAAIGSLYAAHANPYDYSDWTYLNSPVDYAQAIKSLSQRGFSIGVFGHTHRRKIATVEIAPLTEDIEADLTHGVDDATGYFTAEQVVLTDTSWFLAREFGSAYLPVAINAGSVGQPRHSDRLSTMLRMELRTDGVEVEFLPIEYDVQRHLDAIRQSSLSAKTIERLCSYFGASNSRESERWG